MNPLIVKKSVDLNSRMKLGAELREDGVMFSIFSRHATKAWLLLFKDSDGVEPDHVFELTMEADRKGDIWFAYIRGITEGWYYLWKMDGPYDPIGGHLFNPDALLLDPYAKAVCGEIHSFPREKNEKSVKYFSDPSKFAKAVICSDCFDWEGDRPLNRPLADTIIYEMHLRGFSAGNGSDIDAPGTYRGVIDKIDYFKGLGISAVELLPINEFSVFRDNRKAKGSKRVLNNYWGYNTVGFFAPNGRFSASGSTGEQVTEFKEMVKSLHRAGIEVILDIVFNHTAEGGKFDKSFSFKGIDNSIYYMLDPQTGAYKDYTGCGNTFNANHPLVSDLIMDCLHYWVLEMHVDGFRFDLASALNRDENGHLMSESPLISRIRQSPLLRNTKIISESWDAGGGYQVGGFRGRWAEWNGKYRDDIRRFWRGDADTVGKLATRISGSSDLFGPSRRSPQQSINFIFSHDGFTLWDWTSYSRKHNHANGHQNQDGDNHNFSFNHGVEGPTMQARVNRIREKQARNLLATLLFSLGTPMLNGGDEFLRSQKGNNNPYCQDNEITWYDWAFLESNRDFWFYCRQLIQLRKRFARFFIRNFYSDEKRIHGFKEIEWFGALGNPPDWHGGDLALGALLRDDHPDQQCLLLLFNSNPYRTHFVLPKLERPMTWKNIIDTSHSNSAAIFGEKLISSRTRIIYIQKKSLIFLMGECNEKTRKTVDTRKQ